MKRWLLLIVFLSVSCSDSNQPPAPDGRWYEVKDGEKEYHVCGVATMYEKGEYTTCVRVDRSFMTAGIIVCGYAVSAQDLGIPCRKEDTWPPEVEKKRDAS